VVLVAGGAARDVAGAGGGGPGPRRERAPVDPGRQLGHQRTGDPQLGAVDDGDAGRAGGARRSSRPQSWSVRGRGRRPRPAGSASFEDRVRSCRPQVPGLW